MNQRLTWIAGLAVALASLSLSSVLAGNGWLGFGFGAIVAVALAGLLTRMSGLLSAGAAAFLVAVAAMPLLAGPSWAGRITGIVLVALTAGSATGARLLRGFAILACYVALLLSYLNLAFASGPSYGHLIPSDNSLVLLRQLYDQAFLEFKYAPPVPDISAVSLVAAGGIGLVAIMVDLLAVRLRRPAVAGLPLLVLFSVPVATSLKSFGLGQSLTFAAGLIGFLILLSADSRERLRMWGRLVTFRHVQSASEIGPGPDTKELGAAGRRIGLAAICLAVLVPAIVPTVHPHDLFATSRSGGGGGSGSGPGTTILSPLLSVQRQLDLGKPQPVLTYTTNAPDPAQQYLQEYVLNYSNKLRTWLPQFPSAAAGHVVGGAQSLLPVPGLTASTPVTTVTTTITLNKDTSEDVLPMPYAPTQFSTNISEGWEEAAGTLMIFGGLKVPNLSYTVTSEEAHPTAGQIGAVPISQVVIPTGIGNEYGGTYTGPDAAKILQVATADAHIVPGQSALQQAINLQDWMLSASFHYSLKNIPTGKHWLLKFLTTDRRGDCQQYAWAFALIARDLGIPSRIAVGYTAGTTRNGKKWLVTTADAHAWPELYFAGEGWLRFEPTPSGDRGQGTAIVPPYANGRPTVGSPVVSPQTGQSSTNPGPGGATGSPLASRLQHPTGGVGVGSVPQAGSAIGLGLGIGIPVAVLLLLASPALIRLATRRRRWRRTTGDAAVAHAAWLELTDDLADFGLPRHPGETERALARRLTSAAHLDPAAAAAINRVGRAEERARYSTAPAPSSGLRADVLTVRRAVAATLPRRQRLRARLVPASTLTAVAGFLQRASDLLGLLESSWPAIRRAMLGRSARSKPAASSL